MNLPAVIPNISQDKHSKLASDIRSAAAGLNRGDAFDLLAGVAYGLSEADRGRLSHPGAHKDSHYFHIGRDLVIAAAFGKSKVRQHKDRMAKLLQASASLA